ncbi:PEGA domain-containing protein [Deinococcus aquaedulcis]|uniref:PEGA domain-containing protein n=1 Tax=Deinococcus aquaedulcis TaxID=2840455 RepID=UPI001C83A14F|nr:PEGA domain-containing protein [Deinococcus aquaedulcis]
MKRVAFPLLLSALLAACVPAPLRANPEAALRLSVAPAAAPAQPLTGESSLYRFPGPGALNVRTEPGALVTAIVLPPGGGAQVGQTVRTVPGETARLPLPATEGFTQVFTVASLVPLDLGSAAGARSVNDISAAVQRATQGAPRTAYTVATTVYRAERLGSLRVETNVPGAQVRVNGRPAGIAPVTLGDLPAGQVEVTATREGYRPASQRVNIVGDRATDVTLNLRLLTGTLRVESPVAADVLAERRLLGLVLPGQPLEVPVRSGVVSLNVVPRDRALAPQTLLVRVNTDQLSRIECTLTGGAFRCDVR